jgi:large repetitive protein
VLTDTGTVTVTVLAVNDAPVANDDAYSTDEDTPLVVPAASGVLFNDADAEGDDLTAILVQDPLSGTLALEPDGSFTYTPTQDTSGVDFFIYQANDGQADSYFATVTLTIDPVNDAPLAVADVYTTTRNETLVVVTPGVLSNDSDVESDALTVTLVQDVAHGTLTLGDDGSFTYIPDQDFTGIDSFTYQAYDGLAWSDVVTVTINVREISYYIYLPVVPKH